MTKTLTIIRALRGVGVPPVQILNYPEVLGRLVDPAGPPSAQELIAVLTQDDVYPPRQAQAFADVMLQALADAQAGDC